MPSTVRSPSRDAEARHSHSFSESGRMSAVPMWDSSDPERAPPPLPLNPGGSTPTTKPNTSAGIAAAAKAIVERARETPPISSYQASQNVPGSPERSLIKGAHHKRMQSLQTGSVKDLRSYLDGQRSPDKSPERPTSRIGLSSFGPSEDVFTEDNNNTPTPTRQAQRAILGENTPPSATMRALQTMHIPDGFGDMSNGPNTPTRLDFSGQLHNLTSIATSLQKEMASLSRRSKDNATDLISLKEATSKRDEDIRKSLRDLSTNVTAQGLLGPPPIMGTRSSSALGSFMDNRAAFSSPPSAPRAASVNSFVGDERMGSPSAYSSLDSLASLAMLEKIVREMGTKEGQERLLSSLSDLLDKSKKDNVDAAKKVEELSEFIKDQSQSRSLVAVNDTSNRGLGSPAKARGDSDEPSVGTEEVMKMLQRIKDSIAHSGGTTSEVKGLVRDLRGEVLGMGRELGRKLDQAGESDPNTALTRTIGDSEDTLHADEVQRIVEDSMAELKEHVTRLLAQRAEQDDDTFRQLADTRSGSNSEEMMSVIKHALAEHGNELVKHEGDGEREVDSGLDRNSVLDAVKEGLKDFEPNIELQQFGLERDEILAVLKEGLEDYQSNREEPAGSGIDKGEVYEAMQEALKDFRAPFPADALAQVKEELVESVRIALEEHSSAPRGVPMDDENTRAAIMESVKEAFEHHGPAPRELEISRDDLFDAVKASLDGSEIPFGSFGEQLMQQMHDLIEGMRTEFKQYSAASGRDTEQVLDAVKDGLESLRAEIEQYVDRAQDVTGKDEIIDNLRGGLEQLRGDVQGYCAEGPTSDAGNLEMLDYIKSEFEHLHETLGSQNTSRDIGEAQPHQTAAIILAIKEGMDGLKTHVSENGRSRGLDDEPSSEVLESMRGEFDQLKAAILNASAADKGELIETIQDTMGALHSKLGGSELSHLSEGASEDIIREMHAEFNNIKAELDGLKEGQGQAPVSDELLEAMRGEFETLRDGFATSVVRGGSSEEVLDAVRLGLDDLRSHIDKKLDNPDRENEQHGDMLDAINEGLETLRSDVIKTLDKPLDMTVNYEILDTLKDGLAGLRAELDSMKDGRPLTSNGGAVVLAEGAEFGETREFSPDHPTPSAAKASNIENMEVLLSQLQIKIEALDETVHDLPRDGAMKDNLTGLEEMIREVQHSVAGLAEKSETVAPESAARKEDTDAIETLLRNTKSQIEDMALPDPSMQVTKDHIDTLEAVMRVSQEAIDGLADRLENTTAAKDDVAVVEVLAQDVKAALEELKERIPEAGAAESVTRADVDVLGKICTEIKTKVSEMNMPDASEIPSKADIEQLHGLIADFRESHDSMKSSYETDIAITAKAFDDRKQEFEDTVNHINSVKDALAEIKDELMAKLNDSENGLDSIGFAVKDLEGRSGDHEPIIAEVKEMLAREFERSHGSIESMRDLHTESSESALEKQAEHKEAMVSELGQKLDDLFDGLMSKYDDAQNAAQENAKAMEEKASQQEGLLSGTKAMADDLKLSIDTLGSALTAFTATLPEQMDKLAEDSKTVFNRVDDTWNKLDETQEGLKYEHSVTRDEVAKAITAIGGVQADLTEHNPRFMVTLQEVQALIGQHFAHSQQATETAAEHHQAVRDLSEQLKAGFEDTKTRHQTHTEELKSALPLLPAPGESAGAEKYDDTLLHEKLDKLMGHSTEAGQSSLQIERLDEIHEKVMATAAEISAFVATQAKQITADHESKEKESEEVALLLERRMVKKDEVEDEITVLNEEKDSLRSAVEALRAEKESLSSQKSRLQADVSSLETALHIRREELHEMDHKAETIERRIMEGVMNQSRLLLLAKTPKSPQKKKPMGRDLRIPSDGSAISAQTVTSTAPSLKTSHAIQMRSRPILQHASQQPNVAQRRIMSLNQISQNVPNAGQAYSTTSSVASSRGVNRRHSVKPNLLGGSSWGPKRNVSISSHNKENEVLSEEDDEDYEDSIARLDGHEEFGSDAGTERRSSVRRESGMTYDSRSYTEGGTRTSYGTDLSYETGSYMTGTDIDRRTSVGSSADGVVGGEEEQNENENPDGTVSIDQVLAPAPLRIEAPPSNEKHGYEHSSDSGIGTSVPSAMLSPRSALLSPTSDRS